MISKPSSVFHRFSPHGPLSASMQMTLKSANMEAKIGQWGSPSINPNISTLSNMSVIYSTILPTLVVCSNEKVNKTQTGNRCVYNISTNFTWQVIIIHQQSSIKLKYSASSLSSFAKNCISIKSGYYLKIYHHH
jgi:hypothetical protein